MSGVFACLECLLDALGRFPRIVVLPHNDEAPSCSEEAPFRLAIAFDVPGEFSCPPFGIVLGVRTVLRARVPEATPYIDSNLRRAEHDVELASKARKDAAMEPISQTSPMQLATKCKLGFSVAFALRLHLSALGRRRSLKSRLSHRCNNRAVTASASPDPILDEVSEHLVAIRDLSERIGDAIRAGFDEVLDGQRTGRWRLEDLEKTEKTYIGTKIEILVRTSLGIAKGEQLDFLIAGHEVDCKFSLSPGGWMIPIEAQGELCLLLTANDETAQFSAGLLRCEPELLRAPNRDGKRGVLAAARDQIHWLALDESMPENLLRNLPESTIDMILAFEGPRQGQARINELFRHVHRRIVRREVTITVARQYDGMKRARDARHHLQPEGIIILGHQNEHRRIARDLGLAVPRKGELIATRVVLARSDETTIHETTISGKKWREADDQDPVGPGPKPPY